MDSNKILENIYNDLPIKIKLNGEDYKTIPPCPTYEKLKGKIMTEFSISQIESIEYMDDYGEMRRIDDKRSYIKALKKSNGQYHYFTVSCPRENVWIFH